MKKLFLLTIIIFFAYTGCSPEKEIGTESAIEENQQDTTEIPEKEIEKIKEYKYLIYDSNQATNGDVPLISNRIESGATVSISKNTGALRRNDAIFIGWNSERDGTGTHFKEGDDFIINSDTILYAEWEEANFFSDALENDSRVFLRSVEFENEKYHILVKEESSFKLSPDYYDNIIDPFIIDDDAYRFIDDASSEMAGFYRYPEHKYETQYIGASKDGKYGFIDIKNGFQWVIQPIYENVQSFKEGLAAVKLDGKWGYINYTGELVIDYAYDYVFDFFNGLSVVANGPRRYSERKWGVIDKTGQKIIDPNTSPYKRIFNYYESDIAKAYKNSSSSFTALDRTGNELLEGLQNIGEKGGPIDPYFYFSYDSYLCVMATDKVPGQKGLVYGAFDTKGNWIIELQEDYEIVNQKVKVLKLPDDSILPQRGASSWGYINNKEEWIISPQYQYAMDFVNDKAIVKKNNLYGVINKKNEVIIPLEFSKMDRFSGNITAVQKDGLWGIIDYHGNWIIEPEYNYINLANEAESPFYARKGEKAYFVTLENKIIHEFEKNNKYVSFKNGIAFIYTEMDEIDFEKSQQLYKWYAIDLEGNKIFPSNFLEWIAVFLA